MTIQELEQAMLSATDSDLKAQYFDELMKVKAAIERETLDTIYNKENN